MPPSGTRPRQWSNVANVARNTHAATAIWTTIQANIQTKNSSRLAPPSSRTPDGEAASVPKYAPIGGSPIIIPVMVLSKKPFAMVTTTQIGQPTANRTQVVTHSATARLSPAHPGRQCQAQAGDRRAIGQHQPEEESIADPGIRGRRRETGPSRPARWRCRRRVGSRPTTCRPGSSGVDIGVESKTSRLPRIRSSARLVAAPTLNSSRPSETWNAFMNRPGGLASRDCGHGRAAGRPRRVRAPRTDPRPPASSSEVAPVPPRQATGLKSSDGPGGRGEIGRRSHERRRRTPPAYPPARAPRGGSAPSPGPRAPRERQAGSQESQVRSSGRPSLGSNTAP